MSTATTPGGPLRLGARRTARIRLAGALLPLLSACGDTAGPASPDEVAAVHVSPSAAELTVGDSVQLTAVPVNASGQPLSGHPVSWSTDDEAVATVSGSGLVRAVGSGDARITASSRGREGRATIGVPTPAVTTVVIEPSSGSLAEGDEAPFGARALDADGHEVTGRVVQWTSSDAEVAMVAPDGRVTAVRSGSAVVRARVDGARAEAPVSVSADYGADLVFTRWFGVAGLAPELHVQDPGDPDRAAAPLHPTGIRGVAPSPSPDGSTIAFTARMDGQRGIYVVSRDGTGLRALTSDEADDQAAWSPAGDRIAFVRWPLGADADIWIMDAADGGNAVNLTAAFGDSGQISPAWSPALPGGGHRIAFAQVADGLAHIFTVNPDGTDVRQVTFGQVYDDQPAWSPDGTTIVFQRHSDTVVGDLWLVDAGGGNERPLVSLPMGQFDPAWSPDGRLVAFTSKHASGGRYDVYTVWADGSKLARRSYETDTDNESPAWIIRP